MASWAFSNPLGVEPVEEGVEAAARLADQVLVGDEQVVDEYLVGVESALESSILRMGRMSTPAAPLSTLAEEQGEPVHPPLHLAGGEHCGSAVSSRSASCALVIQTFFPETR